MKVSNGIILASPVPGLFEKNLPYQITDAGFIDRENGIEIKLNSKNYRCEEFTKQHNGQHILFSGCSVTYGTGLLEDEIWSKILYNEIKKEKMVSGYFNLAMPGNNVFDIVINIFRYMNEFGLPDTIFISLPDLRRYAIDDHNLKISQQTIFNSVYTNNIADEFFLITELQHFHYLFMLEFFCKVNNIKLFMFANAISKNYIKMPLNCFYTMHEKSMIDFIATKSVEFANDKNMLTARDEKHYGKAYHMWWSNFLNNIYKEDKSNVTRTKHS